MTTNVTFTGRGGLISYGADTRDLNRQAGRLHRSNFAGGKACGFAVVQPTTFTLRVNLKAAKELGLAIPEAFLLLADEVIE
jgi:putative tryptophan/tyrosine transport system substrate-binding protein